MRAEAGLHGETRSALSYSIRYLQKPSQKLQRPSARSAQVNTARVAVPVANGQTGAVMTNVLMRR
jgi:hypothetical protein